MTKAFPEQIFFFFFDSCHLQAEMGSQTGPKVETSGRTLNFSKIIQTLILFA